VVSAVVDALKDYGVTHLDMPIRGEDVWRVLAGGAKA
jgi:carbon-monoxide dehydrogenase large subunit